MMFIVKGSIYPFDVMVCFGSRKKLEKKLKKYNISIEGIELKVGKYLMFESNQSLIWLPKEPDNIGDLATLQHEIYHCACIILDKVGIQYCDESDEAYAYFIQYLTTEIYKELKIFR